VVFSRSCEKWPEKTIGEYQALEIEPFENNSAAWRCSPCSTIMEITAHSLRHLVPTPPQLTMSLHHRPKLDGRTRAFVPEFQRVLSGFS
jgi:hypothetical protein